MGEKGNFRQQSEDTKGVVEFFFGVFFPPSNSNSGSIHYAKRGSLTGCELDGGGRMNDAEQREIISTQ